MKLSIIVPVYNEFYWIRKFWSKFQQAPIEMCTGISSVEIIVIDDGSSDGTTDVLKKLCQEDFVFSSGMRADIRLFIQEVNQGKGAAVQRGINSSTGDVVIIQDADLEYSMNDYPKLIEPIVQEDADAVFGSRFVGSPRRVLYFWHSLINKILTTFCNMLCDLNLTDMETCYKVVRGDLIRSLRITSNRFGLEPELTARLARTKARIYEVPISYRGRTYAEGKKIGIKDGIAAIFHIIRFCIFDREPYKPGMNQALTALDSASGVIYAPILQKAIKGFRNEEGNLQILEIGSGIGTLTKHLLNYGGVTATDISVEYVQKLRDRFRNNDNVNVFQWDASTEALKDFKTYDLIVSFNVLEHIEDDHKALQIWNKLLKPNGRLIVLVPNGPSLYTPIDKALGHFRRYTKVELETKIISTGLVPHNMFYGNAIGVLGWFLRGRIMKKADLPSNQLQLYVFIKKIFGVIERRIERYTGLSVIAVAHKKNSP